MARKPNEVVTLNLRLPERLHRQLAAEVKRTNRSLNKEIVSRLEASFAAIDADGIVAALNRIHRRLGMKESGKA